MSDQRVDQLIDGLKRLADEFEPGVHNHGPIRLRFIKPPPGKEAPWQIRIEAGWDNNYGGTMIIESSKTGKSLSVSVADDEGTCRIYRGDKRL